MLDNDQLDRWDRENLLHPSTHLAQHARGESLNRIMTGGQASISKTATATGLSTGLPDSIA